MQAVEATRQTSRAEIAELFSRQKAARWKVAASTPWERIEKLRRLKTSLVARREQLYDALARDLGKGRIESEISELYPLLIELNYAIRHARKWMRPRRVGTPLLLMGTRNEIRPEPRGVVLIMGPWNYPLYLLLGPVIPAIAAGNCAIVKPSEKAPAMSAFLADLLGSVFPEEELAVVEGDADVAQALLAQPFDHFFFTGGTRIGKKVMEAAARHSASVTLELGGKSPVIVDETADIPATAKRLVWGKFLNAGQTCVAPDYILAHESIAGRLAEEMRSSVERFYGDEASQRATSDYCGIVDQASVERFRKLIDDSLARGARLVTGGETSIEGRYVAPTILMSNALDAGVMEDEIFGPVFPLVTYSDLDAAIELIRGYGKPLSLYVFSRSRKAIERVLRETTSGGVGVNNLVMHLTNPELPFGGVGESGFGSYHGRFGFEAFSNLKAVMIQGWFSAVPLLFPPFGERTRRATNLIRRFLSSRFG